MEMSEKEVIIYVNKKKFGIKKLSPEKSLEKLIIDLEKEIPNQLSFVNGQKSIEKEREKSLTIKDILNESNSIYLNQDYFHVYFDNKLSKRKIDIFKTDSFKNVMKFYQTEFSFKNFFVKCEPDLFIEFINSFIDDTILVKDILIDNAIYVFSLNRKKGVSIFINKNNSLCSLVKKNNIITFQNIKFEKINILDSLLLDDKFLNGIKEANYEKRKRDSLKEYETYKKGSPNKDKIKKIISNNNTNENAVFDYLILLKNENNSKLKEELNKFAYLLDINKLKKLDNKFNDKKFNEYKDEKANLMIFLKDVIDGAYNNCEVSDINLIISELDYRDNIQKDIITPFIDSFNKEIYINNPISISDSNLFFHYLRVKFFHFLQNSFNGIEKKFVYFCEILYNKIVSMTSEKSPDLKKNYYWKYYA